VSNLRVVSKLSILVISEVFPRKKKKESKNLNFQIVQARLYGKKKPFIFLK